jgi:tRNA pseudouridine38-40 synthase
MAEKNIRLLVEYNGAYYCGWQVQPDENTVQGEMIEAIRKVTGKNVTLYAAGRTDSGVHALGQVVNFRIDHDLPLEKYKDAINYFLPRSILVKKVDPAPDDFSARYSAVWRRYKYVISHESSALYHDYRWEYLYPLNPERMQAIAEYIEGRHDFSAFCKVASLKDNNECEIFQSRWRTHGSLLVYDIRANRFLHTMVRSLVGAMILAGRENDYLTLENFRDIMDSKDHTRLKMVAPARGLYLVEAGYE